MWPELQALFHRHPAAFQTTATMQGFVRLRPHGYPGDFELIERVYNRTCTVDPRARRWDEFFHKSAGAFAVRNREAVAADLVGELRPGHVFSAACGPGLDFRRALAQGDSLVSLTLLDNDAGALKRAQVNLQPTDLDVQLVCRNIFRFRPERSFDFIWCSGLFDYLSDRSAVHLLRRFRDFLAAGGAVVVGNFTHDNPSRAYMECVGDWRLVHRSAHDLLSLAEASGFASGKTRVFSEPTGLNLFLSAVV
jgi:hypothetical protein